MLLSLPDFEYLSCDTVEEACSLLSSHEGEARVFAGGTDLLVKMKHRRIRPRYLINIKKIPGLDSVRYDEDDGLRIGALATVESLTHSSVIMQKFSVLSQAAGLLGTPHIRTLATVGGNICNASPAADCATALLTLEAKGKIAGPRGERVVPLDTFFTGPGESILERDEILTEIEIPKMPPSSLGVHLKYGSRRVDIAVVGVSMSMTAEGQKCQDIKIALSAVGPTPFRAKKAEAVLRGEMLSREKGDLVLQAALTASEESVPIDDLRGRADYRKQLVQAMVTDGIQRLISWMSAQTTGSRSVTKRQN